MGFPTYLAGRLFGALATVLAGSFAIFLVIQAAPGDPALAVLQESASPQAIADFRRAHGLDRPVLVQYAALIGNALHGDLGQSLTMGGGVPISRLILQRLPNTVFLGLYAIGLALALSLVAGTVAASQRGRGADAVVTMAAVGLISMPDFWLSYMLVLLFALRLGVFPAYGFTPPGTSLAGALSTGFLPALSICAAMTGFFSRILRASLLETWRRPYVVAARSFGLGRRFIYLHYILRNAVVPLVVVMGFQVRHLLGGVVVIEKVFGIPGLGSLIVDGAFARDYPLVLACSLTFLTVVVLVNLGVDLACTALDPRRSR